MRDSWLQRQQCRDGMELNDLDGDLFANIAMANNVYLVRLNVIPPKAAPAAWTIGGSGPTHGELVERLGKVVVSAHIIYAFSRSISRFPLVGFFSPIQFFNSSFLISRFSLVGSSMT